LGNVTVCGAWRTCHSTRHTSITTLQSPLGFYHGVEAILVHFVEVFTLSESAAVDPTAIVLGRLHREQRGLERCQLQRLVTLRAHWRRQRVRLEHGSGHHAVSRDAWDRTSITDMNFQLCHACRFASNQASNKITCHCRSVWCSRCFSCRTYSTVLVTAASCCGNFTSKCKMCSGTRR
jgi:hypothetical protein